MDARKLAKLKKDLTTFLDEVAGTLGNPRRRRWCESYLRGVLLDGHRKSIEPMAARLKAIEQGDHDYEQALQQFLNQSPWDEQDILDGLQRWVARQFGTDGVLIIDDTGFPKQGQHSVGVARQYTGTLGKIASCQVAVTLQFATAAEVVGLAAGIERKDDGAIRRVAGPSRSQAIRGKGTAGAVLAPRRMARRRRPTREIFLQQSAPEHESQTTGRHGQEPVVG